MSFATRSGGYPHRVLNPVELASVVSSPGGGGTTTWKLSLMTTGDMTFRSTDNAGGSTLQDSAWYLANTANIGASYWVRMTVTAGTSPTGESVATWVSLGGVTKEWDWIRTTVGTTTATITLEIASDSAGSTVVGSKAGITLSLEKSV